MFDMTPGNFYIAIFSNLAQSVPIDQLYNSTNVGTDATEAQDPSRWSMNSFECRLLPAHTQILFGDRFSEIHKVEYTRGGNRCILNVQNVTDGWVLVYDFKKCQIRIDYQAVYTVTDLDKEPSKEGSSVDSLMSSFRF